MSEERSNSGRRASHLVVADAMYGPKFWEGFCRYGRDHHAIDYAVVCFQKSQMKPYQRHPDLFRSIDYVGDLRKFYGMSETDHGALKDFAQHFEEQTGSLITDIIQADRHLGRGYFFAGMRHPKSSLSVRANYWDTVQLIKEYCQVYTQILSRGHIEVVVLGAVASLQTKLLCLIARSQGVAVRLLATARSGNRYTWATDEFSTVPSVERAFEKIVSIPPETELPACVPTCLDGYKAATNYQKWFAGRFTMSGLARAIGSEIKREARHIAYSVYRPREKKIGHYHFLSILANHINVFLDYRAYERACNATWAAPQAVPYVYFPLHVEPEASLMVFSPEFNNQVAAIDLIAKSLPAGVFLVVKEHVPAVGRRPLGFYLWLKSIPNVTIAPLEADGPELARNSRATVTFTGTAGFEAAVAGVPVLTFGQHNFYNVLDHVHLLRDLDQIRVLLREVISDQDGATQRRLDGKRLLKAVRKVSVDLGEETLSRSHSPSHATIEKLFSSFRSTIELG